jgi:hypothetical protein
MGLNPIFVVYLSVREPRKPVPDGGKNGRAAIRIMMRKFVGGFRCLISGRIIPT